MKVTIDDEFWASGCLSKLARTLGIRESDALGRLLCVWRRTQQALVSTETIDRLVTLIVIDFDSDDEARHFIFAMTASRLAVVQNDGTVTICGNLPRIQLAAARRAANVRGGSIAASHRNTNKIMKSTGGPADVIAEEFQLSPKRNKRGRTEEQQARGLSINRLYRQLYIHTYRKEPTGMDARANATLAKFSDAHAENAETILRAFFATSNKDSRGHGVNWLTVTAQALWSQAQGGPRVNHEPSWDEKMAALEKEERDARLQDEVVSAQTTASLPGRMTHV